MSDQPRKQDRKKHDNQSTDNRSIQLSQRKSCENLVTTKSLSHEQKNVSIMASEQQQQQKTPMKQLSDRNINAPQQDDQSSLQQEEQQFDLIPDQENQSCHKIQQEVIIIEDQNQTNIQDSNDSFYSSLSKQSEMKQQIQESYLKVSSIQQLINHVRGQDVNIKLIIEKGKKISDQGLEAISKKLENMQYVQKLKLILKDQNVSDLGIERLSKSLEKLKNLQFLQIDIQHNQITEYGLLFISQSLSQLTQLKNLKINVFSNKISDKGIQILSNALHPLKNLKELALNLGNNNIKLKGIAYLQEGLKKSESIQKLSLNLQQLELGQKGSELMKEMLKSLQKLKNISLNLGHTKLTDESLKNIIDGLKNKVSLVVLKLQVYGNQIKDNSLQEVQDLVAQLPNLKSLSLDFLSTDLTSQCIQYWQNNLHSLNKIVKCHLRFPEIIGESFGKMLESLTSVKEIKVSTMYCSQMVMKSLSKIPQLKSLVIETGIELSQSQINNMVQGISHLRQISSLNLNLKKIQMTQDCQWLLQTSLIQLDNLRNLKIRVESQTQMFTVLNGLQQLNRLSVGICGSKIENITLLKLMDQIGKMKNLEGLTLLLDDTVLGQKTRGIMVMTIKGMDGLKKVQVRAKDWIRQIGAGQGMSCLLEEEEGQDQKI